MVSESQLEAVVDAHWQRFCASFDIDKYHEHYAALRRYFLLSAHEASTSSRQYDFSNDATPKELYFAGCVIAGQICGKTLQQLGFQGIMAERFMRGQITGA